MTKVKQAKAMAFQIVLYGAVTWNRENMRGMKIGAFEMCWRRVVTIGHSRTPLIRPPSESHWCGRIRGMVAREGFI